MNFFHRNNSGDTAGEIITINGLRINISLAVLYTGIGCQ